MIPVILKCQGISTILVWEVGVLNPRGYPNDPGAELNGSQDVIKLSSISKSICRPNKPCLGQIATKTLKGLIPGVTSCQENFSNLTSKA